MLVSLLLAAVLGAASGDITGSVVDQSGGVVAGAKVTVERPSGSPLIGATDLKGTFRFTELPAGTYQVRVEHPGFKVAGMRVKLGDSPARLRMVLRIADLHERLTVGSPEARVSPESAENMDVVKLDRRALNKLPVLGNDIIAAASQYLDQAALGAAGVSVVVDGMEARKIGVSASAVQEVRINQNPYSAEFARPGRGRIEIITKPAAGEYHGSIEFVFRDHRLDARNAFAATRPAEQRRIFEGHFTGPVGHSKKTAFLLSANHEEEDLQNLVFAITPAGVLRQNFANPKRQTEVSGSITRQLTDRQTLSTRYELSRDQGQGEDVGGFTLPVAGADYKEREHLLFVNYRAVLTPRIVNEFSMRLGHQSFVNSSRTPGVPRIVVQDAFTGGGGQSDRHETENRIQFNNIVSWAKGRHLVRAGVTVPGFIRRGLNDHANYDGTFSYSSLDDYLAHQPFLFEVQRGNGYLAFWQKDLGFFVQDDFKARPNLSISIGLRYDWQNHLSDHNNLAPRFSLAFSPDKKRKTVLRASGGIFYERTGNGAIADLLRFDGLRLRRLVLTNPAYPDPLSAGGSLEAQPASMTRFAPDLRSPYLLQYGGGVERQLQKSLVLALNYTGITGVKTFRSRDLNAPLPPLYLARPIAAIGVLRTIESAGRLQSHSLDLTLRGSIKKYFNGTIQHGFGRAYNNTGGIAAFPANSYNLSGEWARSSFDVRHRFRALGTVKAGELFELGTVLSVSSGAPYTITTGRDDNHDGRASDRPAGVPRNSKQGFGAANLDLRLSHEFKLTDSDKDEAPSLDAGIEAFNMLNGVNYTNVVGNLSSPFFGQPVAARPARRLQLRLEFKF
jgi:hypothetical protein